MGYWVFVGSSLLYMAIGVGHGKIKKDVTT